MHLCIQYMITSSSLAWFPNSDIRGSRLICSSPRLFAACHVLRRLPMPRHSPYALLRLNYFCICPFKIYTRFSSSRLNCCVSYLQCILDEVFSLFVRQNCFLFYPLRKNLISLQFLFTASSLSFFPFTFVCHVFHTNSVRINMSFSYSVFNEHSLIQQLFQPFVKLYGYSSELLPFKYL